jgi:hypothetical protein
MEICTNLKFLFEDIKYKEKGWTLRNDLNIIRMSMLIDNLVTQKCDVLCEWDSRAQSLHWMKKQ